MRAAEYRSLQVNSTGRSYFQSPILGATTKSKLYHECYLQKSACKESNQTRENKQPRMHTMIVASQNAWVTDSRIPHASQRHSTCAKRKSRKRNATSKSQTQVLERRSTQYRYHATRFSGLPPLPRVGAIIQKHAVCHTSCSSPVLVSFAGDI